MDAYLNSMGVTQWRLRTPRSSSDEKMYFCAVTKNIFLIAVQTEEVDSAHEALFKKIAAAIDVNFEFSVTNNPVYPKSYSVIVLGDIDQSLIPSECSVLMASSLPVLMTDVAAKKILWQKIKESNKI